MKVVVAHSTTMNTCPTLLHVRQLRQRPSHKTVKEQNLMKRKLFIQCAWLIWGMLCLSACSTSSPRQLVVYQVGAQIWAMNPDGTQQHVLVKTKVGTVGPRLSPDGSKIAFVAMLPDGKQAVWIADSDGTNPHQVGPEMNNNTIIAWLNQNMLLTRVITDIGRTWDNPQAHYVLDVQSGTIREYSQGPESVVPLSQGDHWLAWNPIPGTITLYSLRGQSQRLFSGYGFYGPVAFDVSPSGEEIVFEGWKGAPIGPASIYRAKIVPDSSTEPQKILPLDNCGGIRWSPDGKWIALMDQSNQFYIVDAKTNKVKWTFRVEDLIEGPRPFIWSPDSQWLLVKSLNYGTPGVNNVLELGKVDIQMGKVIRLTNNDQDEVAVDWGFVR
jgi:dipeptidyl aminopeptidase/acylaminoacyl peptidase